MAKTAPTAARRTLPIPHRFMTAPETGVEEVAPEAVVVGETTVLTGVLDLIEITELIVVIVLLLTTGTRVETGAGVTTAVVGTTGALVAALEIGGTATLDNAMLVDDGARVDTGTTTEVVGTTGATDETTGGMTIELLGVGIGATGREVGAWICPSPI